MDKQRIEPTTEITEVCPHCDSEVNITWNVATQGFKTKCHICKKDIMICSECLHNHNYCDWKEKDGCYRNK